MSSSVAGIFALMVLVVPLLAAVTAIVTGVMARKQIARSQGALKGKGMALAGIICGAISLLGATVIGTAVTFAVMRTSDMLEEEAEAAAAAEAQAKQLQREYEAKAEAAERALEQAEEGK